VFEQIVLLAAVVAGVTFARSIRRRDPGQRPYQLLVAAVCLLAIAALGESRPFLGVIAVSGALLLVIVPGIFEWLARVAFHRGRLAWAVRFAGWRAMLMPGAGLSRQQQILQGLALLEREGVDRALAHFRALADDTEDGGEIALINEQIVSMLFYGQRWDEGIAHYEARFHPRYAAMRPALALGLLRAYGESGRLETAAGLLRALEEGPIGHDPRARGLVSQAQLTFLAYAGEAPTVASALSEPRRRALGLSAASGALLCGIALARAGEVDQAAVALRDVERLAGSADDRVVDASRGVMERLSEVRIEVPPELTRYVATVAERLERFLELAPAVRRAGPLVATPVAVTLLVAGYAAVVILGRGVTGILVLGGLTPQLWHAGGWGRALLGIFVGTEPLALLLAVYAVWLAGPLIERVHGRGRLVATLLLGGGLGLALGAATCADSARLLAGGSLAAISVTVGALWTLLPSRTPGLLPRARRSLMVPLGLVAAALVAHAVPGIVAAPLPAIGVLWASVVGTVLVGVIPIRGVVAKLVGWSAVPLVALLPLAAWQVAHEDIEATELAHRTAQVVSATRLEVPARFGRAEAGGPPGLLLPLQSGLVDELERLGRGLVQVVVVPADDAPEAGATGHRSALLRLDPSLDRELGEVVDAPLPPAFAAAWSDLGADAPLAVTGLRRNGTTVAIVVERAVGGRSVALVAAPPSVLDHAPAIYAAILADARPAR
jgi:hypothetical protein